jgi:hypothetical protein
VVRLDPTAEQAHAQSVEAERVFGLLADFGPALAVKLYRLVLPSWDNVPALPCLDHEAMLHTGIAPHAAAYVQETATGDLHELVCIPAERRIEVDTVSTWGESSLESRARLLALLRERVGNYRVVVRGPSGWRGERRVATACHAQVSLKDVLLGRDVARVKGDIQRLQVIGALMEKQSRVASWGVRTVTGPFLTAAGVLSFFGLGRLSGSLGEEAVTALRYLVLSLLGGVFLYYGLKAVQLTDMSNRVWKRTAEYTLILGERQRLAEARPKEQQGRAN